MDTRMSGILAGLLTLHFLTVYVAGIAPFLCLWLEWRESAYGDKLAGRLGRRLAREALLAVLVGSGLGFLALYLGQLNDGGRFLSALWSVPSRGEWLGMPERLWSALGELLLYVIAFGIYAIWWRLGDDRDGRPRWWGRLIHRLLALFAGTNLLYHFPVLFAVAGSLLTNPTGAEPVRFLSLMGRPEVLTRVIHGWLAATAITGGYLMLAVYREADPEDAKRATTWGARLTLLAVGLQLPAGYALFTQLPTLLQGQLLGGSLWSAGLFALAVLGTIGLLQMLSSLAAGDIQTEQVGRTLGLLVGVLLLMVFVRQAHRDLLLQTIPTRPATVTPASLTLVPHNPGRHSSP